MTTISSWMRPKSQESTVDNVLGKLQFQQNSKMFHWEHLKVDFQGSYPKISKVVWRTMNYFRIPSSSMRLPTPHQWRDDFSRRQRFLHHSMRETDGQAALDRLEISNNAVLAGPLQLLNPLKTGSALLDVCHHWYQDHHSIYLTVHPIKMAAMAGIQTKHGRFWSQMVHHQTAATHMLQRRSHVRRNVQMELHSPQWKPRMSWLIHQSMQLRAIYKPMDLWKPGWLFIQTSIITVQEFTNQPPTASWATTLLRWLVGVMIAIMETIGLHRTPGELLGVKKASSESRQAPACLTPLTTLSQDMCKRFIENPHHLINKILEVI